MSFLDPLVSGVDSLLDPLTSGLGSTETSSAAESTSTEAASDTPSTSVAVQPTTTSSIIVTPVVTTSEQPAATTSDEPSNSAATSSSPSSKAASSTSTQKTSNSKSSTSTTLSTSTRSASTSSSSSSISSTSLSSKTTASTISATSSAAASISPTPKPAPENGNKVSTAGIVIASIVAALVVASIIYAIVRYCPPVRRRLDAWRAKGFKDRSYREAIDGPAVPEKDAASTNSGPGLLPSSHSRVGSNESEKTLVATTATAVPVTGAIAKEIHVIASSPAATAQAPTQPKRLSFFGLKQNPLLPFTNLGVPREQRLRYSWENSTSRPEILNQSYTSPNTASVGGASRGYGLGLGSMSVLRNSTLTKKAELQTRPTGPSIDASQAVIANMKPNQRAGDVKRKPVAIGQSHAVGTPTGSPEEEKPRQRLRVVNPDVKQDDAARASWVQGDEDVLMAGAQGSKERPRQSAVPSIQIDAPTPPIERISQIGLAVSSTPPPGNRGSVGVAR